MDLQQLQRDLENIQREIGDGGSSSSSSSANGGGAFARRGGALARAWFFYWASFLFMLVVVAVTRPAAIFMSRPEDPRIPGVVVRRFSLTRYLLVCLVLWSFLCTLFWAHTALLNPKKGEIGQ